MGPFINDAGDMGNAFFWNILCFFFYKCFSICWGTMVWLDPSSILPVSLPNLCFPNFPIMSPTPYHTLRRLVYFSDLRLCWENWEPQVWNLSNTFHAVMDLLISILGLPPGSADGCNFCFLISTAPSLTLTSFFFMFNKDLVCRWTNMALMLPASWLTLERLLPGFRLTLEN